MPSDWKKGGKRPIGKKKNRFLNSLELESSYTRTLNGAKTHSTSGDACLDFFAVAGGMRYRSPLNQISLFDRAYVENPELAMKLLFYIRDIRGGMGERDLFRTLIRHVAKCWKESARKNVHLIAEYGRWDDLLCLFGTASQKEAVRVMKEQLEGDLEALSRREKGEVDAPISLLAKWLPSDNASSPRTRGQAIVVMHALGMDQKTYRSTLTKLRANIGLTERYLTQRIPEKISYGAVPADAMLKYRRAFAKRDGERFDDYLVKVAAGEETIHTQTLYPYEILRPFFKEASYFRGDFSNVEGADTLEMLWANQVGAVGNGNAISIVDTSGSMFWHKPGTPMPILISMALGLYCAEHCKGVFHNYFINFDTNPHLVKVKGDTLADKLRYMSCASWGGSTNLEAVFDLILRTAVNAGAGQEEMPTALYIFSDMEFNMAVNDPDKTVYETAKEKFKAYGYELPAVVFQNVNSWQMQVPVRKDTKGAALTSGAGTACLGEKFDGNVTPMSHMLKVLLGERYEPVHA